MPAKPSLIARHLAPATAAQPAGAALLVLATLLVPAALFVPATAAAQPPGDAQPPAAAGDESTAGAEPKAGDEPSGAAGRPEAPPPPPADKPAPAPPPPAPADPPLLGPAPAAPEPAAAPSAEAATGEGGTAGAEATTPGADDGGTDAGRDVSPDPTSEVYAEDWWSLSHPVFELHGYYRVRAEFFNSFTLGRRDAIKPLWPQPPDNDYFSADKRAPHRVELCGDKPDDHEPCDNATQAGANMRFRLNPELHISDNLRVRSQIDLLDNIVLGSTPQGYANQPSDGGYQVVARGGYSPTGAFVSTQWAPSGGYNSFKDSILVKRVWGEYSSPVGQLRFGRMPSHWGLGMLVNNGDGYDSDWQSTADRIMFVTGVRSWDLYFAGMWDFANEGAVSASAFETGGQPYDLAQKDDVDQWVFVVVRRRNEQLQRAELAKGLPVFNGGGYVVYRNQRLANDQHSGTNDQSLGQDPENISQGLQRRGAEAVIPDLWLQFLYKKFRFEMEAAMIYGSLESIERTQQTVGDGTDYEIRQFGLATQTEFRAFEDRLKLQFDFGYSSGDDDVESLAPLGQELQPQLTSDRTYSTFRFHPDYRVDLILFRNVLSRVQGAYYFKPSVAYDFLRDPDGQRLGGTAGLIWSRASEFLQTPGHARDLGVELNFQVHYQAKDGVLNDDPDKMGGFYTQLQYGVLFPLDGMGYLQGEIDEYADLTGDILDTETAHTVRWYLGVLF